MTAPTLDSTYRFDNKTQRWHDSATGRFVPRDNVIAEMRVHQEATFSTLERLTNRLYNREISLAQWQLGIASELKDAHLAQAMFGAGGRANMGFTEWGRVGQTLREQYAFLDKFAADIAAGRQSQAQALARVKQYGLVSQGSYWNEFAAQNKTKKFNYRLGPTEHCGPCVARVAGNPYAYEDLQGVPGDGSTPCRGYDACTLEVEE